MINSRRYNKSKIHFLIQQEEIKAVKQRYKKGNTLIEEKVNR